MRRLREFRYSTAARGVTSRALGIVILCLLIIYYVPTRQQSFVVSATTETLRVETLGDGATEWDLPSVEACLRTEAATKSPQDPEWCASSRYSYHALEDVFLRWEAGYVLTFRAYGPDYVEIYVEHAPDADPVLFEAGHRVTNRSILRVPYAAGDLHTRIPMRGYATIGDVPNASDALLLSRGAYEVRQTLGVIRPESHVVKAGDFFPGDRVSFANTDPPFWYFWHKPEADRGPWTATHLFIAQGPPDSRAFTVVATTEPAFSALQLTRIGGGPTNIAVPWTQRLVADALPVALATFLGLVGSIIALANAYIRQDTGSEK